VEIFSPPSFFSLTFLFESSLTCFCASRLSPLYCLSYLLTYLLRHGGGGVGPNPCLSPPPPVSNHNPSSPSPPSTSPRYRPRRNPPPPIVPLTPSPTPPQSPLTTHRVYVISTRTERTTLNLAHFPLPFFHFAESDLPPTLPTSPISARPSLTLDGTDLIGQFFNDPDLVLCRLAPGEGNLDPTGPQIQAGWVPTLRYTALGGATHTCQQDVVSVLL
jgi:hypothetical protein